MTIVAALCRLLVTTPCLVAGGRVSLEDTARKLALEEDTSLAEVRARAGANTSQLAGEDARLEAHGASAGSKASQLTKWELFGWGGPKMTDVSQGQLGNCYFLAVLAAIANTHPNRIEDAFLIKGETSRRGQEVFQVRFLLDGVETKVALDEQVPVKHFKSRYSSGLFFFASTNDGDTVWPILMEKGWAKLFGSYLATVAGNPAESFRAITQAPVHTLRAKYDMHGKHHWPNPNKLWDDLREAIDNNFPMAASSTTNSVGTVAGHAFAVIGLSKRREPRAVRVYNPWASNRYKGALKTDTSQDQGDYFLTFEEFQEAFEEVDMAHIRDGYRISFVRVAAGEPVALKFTIRRQGPFAVQLEWPTPRFVDIHGCRLDVSHAKLMIRKEGGANWQSAGRGSHSNLRAELYESGTYLLYAFASFPGAPVVSQVAVNVYAHEDVEFMHIHRPPLDVGREIMGVPCQFLVRSRFFWTDIYEAVPYPVGGGPAWKKRSSNKVIWVDGDGHLTRSPSVDALDKYHPGFPFGDLECKHEVKQEAKPDDMPEEKEDAVPTGCGLRVGDRIEYEHQGEWICAEIESFWSQQEVEVRYHANEKEYLDCRSPSLRRVMQCPWEEQDKVEFYNKDRGQWVEDRIKEVLCGEVLLESGWTVPCGQSYLRYPHGCPFHDGEKVIVWSRRLERWQFTRVARVEGDEAVVRSGSRIPCDDRDRLRKLTRCEKLTDEQMRRFSRLNNLKEVLAGRDEEFPPNLGSIGPPSADCGDSANGNGPQACDQYNVWGRISEVLH